MALGLTAAAALGRFELQVTLDEKSIRCDADNCLKQLIDYLVMIEMITDDSPKYMRSLLVTIGKKECVTITITPLEGEDG